jgi:hypothetical protein
MIERLFASSLSVSLILLALAAVLAVFAYNAWVARKRGAPRRETLAAGRGSGAVPTAGAAGKAGGGRGEPSLGEARGAAGTGASGAAESLAAGFSGSGADTGADSPADPAATTEESPTQGRLHPFTDCIVEFHLDDAVMSDRLLPIAHAFRRVGGKPVILEGSPVHADDPAPPEWAAIAARQRLFRVRVGVLLANRHGPLNAMEYSEFVTGVQSVAEQLSLLGDTPDMPLVLQRARSLDETFAGLDGQIGLNVAAPDPLGLTDLARLAQETGCVERGNNRHARLTAQGDLLFSLSLSDAPDRLSLLLDVPRAPIDAHPWEEMVACARHCAQRLGGRLIDDQGRELSDTALERIAEQLRERQQALVEAGLQPGSTLALRVFN